MARDFGRPGCTRFSALAVSAGLLALCGLITPHGIASAEGERDEKTLQESRAAPGSTPSAKARRCRSPCTAA